MSKYVRVGTIQKKDVVVPDQESKQGYVPQTDADKDPSTETSEEVPAVRAQDVTSRSEGKKPEKKKNE